MRSGSKRDRKFSRVSGTVFTIIGSFADLFFSSQCEKTENDLPKARNMHRISFPENIQLSFPEGHLGRDKKTSLLILVLKR